MNNRLLYRAIIVLLIVSTLTCNLVMVGFLERFFYGGLEVREPETLYRVVSTLSRTGPLGFLDYERLKERADAYDQLEAVYIERGIPVYEEETVRWLDIAWATGGFDKLIGVSGMVAGRMFDESDDDPGAEKVAVVSQSLWSQLGSAPAFEFGTQLLIKGKFFDIVGVVESRYPRINSMEGVDVWLPARQNPLDWQFLNTGFQRYQILSRLDPAKVSMAQHQTAQAFEDTAERLGYEFSAAPWRELEFRVGSNDRMHRLFMALAVVTSFLFVMGVVNQALMLMTRSVAIQGDLKIMMALGARPKHVLLRFVRGFFALLGVSLAAVGLSAFAVVQFYNGVWGAIYGIVEVNTLVEPLPLLALLLMAVLLVLLHIGFPLLVYLVNGDGLMLRERAAGSRFSIKSKLSVAGVALQIAMVTCTALGSSAFLLSLREENSVQATKTDDRIVMLELAFAAKSKETLPQRRPRIQRIKSALMELGGVEAMGFSKARLLRHSGWTSGWVEGRQNPDQETDWTAYEEIGPGYFEAAGLKMLEGEGFTLEDCTIWPIGSYVVNQAYVDKFFPGEQAIGRRVALWSEWERMPIKGVVENEALSLDGHEWPCLYVPMVRERGFLTVKLSDAALVGKHPELIKQTIQSVDSGIIVVSIQSVDAIWKDVLSSSRLGFYVLLALSLVGLALSLSGVFGYQSYMMLLRSRELAIRHALGQKGSALYRSELRRVCILVGIGLALGAGSFFALRRVFSSVYFPVELSWLGAGVTLALLAAAFLATVSLATLGAWKPKLESLTRD